MEILLSYFSYDISYYDVWNRNWHGMCALYYTLIKIITKDFLCCSFTILFVSDHDTTTEVVNWEKNKTCCFYQWESIVGSVQTSWTRKTYRSTECKTPKYRSERLWAIKKYLSMSIKYVKSGCQRCIKEENTETRRSRRLTPAVRGAEQENNAAACQSRSC